MDFLLRKSPKDEFYMVNLFKYREMALYEDGRPTALTGREAQAIYENFLLTEILPTVGAEVVFNATIADPIWDHATIIKYPNGSAYLTKILTNREVQNQMILHR